MNTSLIKLFLLCAIFIGQSVYADQNSPELDKLFNELKASQSPDVAEPIAKKIWAEWMKTDDRVTNQLMEQGMDEIGMGNLTGGRDIFTMVTERSPDFAEGWNKLATVNYMMGDIDESLKHIDKTLALEPRHFGSISGRGLCYIKLNRLQSALIEFKAALDVHPWMKDARHNLKLLEDNLENYSI